MKALPVREMAMYANVGFAGPDMMIPEVCTDTRDLSPGCLFVALTGENFDGHDYIPAALEKGAAFALSEREDILPGDPRVLRTPDTRAALLGIAGHYRKLLGIRVAAVTGSVGKTTTKEMTALVLGAKYKTLKTPANLNNEIGLARTILTLEEDHRAAVLELGVDGPGQMLPLAKCAAPDIGIITSIGVSHLSQFGTRRNILEEKLRLREGMPDGSALVLCGDNDLLSTVDDFRLRVIRYGVDNPACEPRGENIREEENGTRFDILYGDERFNVFIPCLGRHNVLNALAGFVAGAELGVEPKEAARALENYRPQGMRQKMVEHNGMLVVEDCYNASPDSMRAALDTLAALKRKGKRIAVLSDMLELGEIEREQHSRIGEYAAHAGIDLLLCTGSLSALIREGALSAGFSQAHHFDTQDALFDYLTGAIQPGDALWFKASRGMRLERLIERLYAI